MLSVLIPTYNYNVYPLVLELNEQCIDCGIDYEIIVLDDASNTEFLQNNQINILDNCRYLINEKNFGRGPNINKLVDFSKFEYILLLEADAFPTKKNYIQLYVNALKQKPQAVFGGVIYAEEKPPENTLLRWIYGKKRESKDLNHRLKHPLDIVFSWNLLLHKNHFNLPLFEASIIHYGFEDLVFLKKLKKQNTQIIQIDNSLIHQNEENSTVFIEKSKIALKTLKDLYQQKILTTEDSRLIKTFEILRKWYLIHFSIQIFNAFENVWIKNLLSKKPSLFLFDLYRLGYFCKLTQLEKK